MGDHPLHEDPADMETVLEPDYSSMQVVNRLQRLSMQDLELAETLLP